VPGAHGTPLRVKLDNGCLLLLAHYVNDPRA
jgi:hypothetical protein